MIGFDRKATRRYLVLIAFTMVLALVGAAATVTFLAQINRCAAVQQVGGRSGRYRLVVLAEPSGR